MKQTETLHKDKRQQAVQTNFLFNHLSKVSPQCQMFTHSLFSQLCGLDVNKADKVKNKTLFRTVVYLKPPREFAIQVSQVDSLLTHLNITLALTHPTPIFRRINLLFFFSFKEKVGYLIQQIQKSSFENSKKATTLSAMDSSRAIYSTLMQYELRRFPD